MSDPDPLVNLRTAYQILKHNVVRTLCTQRGAPIQLNHQVTEDILMLQQQRVTIPPAELATVEQVLADMVSALNAAHHELSDQPTAPTLVVTSQTSTGGRPRVNIDPEILAEALLLRGPSHLQQVFGVSAQTVRRHALEYGLAEPGEPVYTETPQPDGSTSHTYRLTAPAMSPISDADLDSLLASILETFPNFGRQMLSGRLKSQGHRVSRERITASYLRIVIHCFIDGKSRVVTGIHASNNNRAETVLDIFKEVVAEYGLPSRV
ncbi:hypothetical protein C8F04DRAFT_966327, partial [Mycena alexandri]